MGYRTFVDKDGAYWQVWDSQPTKVERRTAAADRRKPRFFPWRETERRSGQDRRLTTQRRITLAEGYGSGWIDVALAVWIASFVVGIGFLGPESGRIGRLIEERGVSAPEVRRRIDRIFLISRIELLFLLIVVVDMVTKPGT